MKMIYPGSAVLGINVDVEVATRVVVVWVVLHGGRRIRW
jgi:hypothetical protein